MKNRLAMICGLLGLFLATDVALADGDASSAGSHAEAYVKDSAITTKVKTKLAAEHLTSLAHIHVATDTNGVVWLSGTAETEAAIRKAISIARHTDGVRAVHNRVKVDKNE